MRTEKSRSHTKKGPGRMPFRRKPKPANPEQISRTTKEPK